jgi:hypothetical protein
LVRLPFDLFVDASENLVVVNDVATPSNPPIAPVEKEKLEDAPLNGRAKKNRPEKWCVVESIVRLGIVDCLLTHMP